MAAYLKREKKDFKNLGFELFYEDFFSPYDFLNIKKGLF